MQICMILAPSILSGRNMKGDKTADAVMLRLRWSPIMLISVSVWLAEECEGRVLCEKLWCNRPHSFKDVSGKTLLTVGQ
jgi:hypothetical protein